MIFDWILRIFAYLWLAATFIAYVAFFGAIMGITYGVITT
jgi:hypothetical protein